MSDQRRPRRTGLRGRPIAADSPLLGGPIPDPEETSRNGGDSRPGYDHRADSYALPPPVRPGLAPRGPEAELPIPAPEGSRQVDDWGRSERVLAAMNPLLDFYYRYWFRVEVEGIEKVPSEGGALLVSNHSGALPPDAPMIMQALRSEHPAARPVYMLGEHWFKGYPGVGMLTNKLGLVPAHPENAQRLLRDEGRLALVFPEGQKGTSKVVWQRYRLRRFGRGGFVRTALRAQVPIVPIALIGGEEAMPIFAHMRTLQRLTGLIYAPFNHAFPQFGPFAAVMYLPAKFRIRFLDPIDLSDQSAELAEDPAAVQEIAEEIRSRIDGALQELLGARESVWLG